MFRGTTKEQDARFVDSEKKQLNEIKKSDKSLYKLLSQKVPKKDESIMNKWIEIEILKLLNGVEDDILVEMIGNQLEEGIEGKEILISLYPFLGESKAGLFMKDLWFMLLGFDDTKVKEKKPIRDVKPHIISEIKTEIKPKRNRFDGELKSIPIKQEKEEEDNSNKKPRKSRFDR